MGAPHHMYCLHGEEAQGCDSPECGSSSACTGKPWSDVRQEDACPRQFWEEGVEACVRKLPVVHFGSGRTTGG